ncbi:MAG: MBL fold metallo-hydrolase, partial [Candidatus Hydrogenedentes bacterium]|nr:MBL fold metallo-hydrolase [Candidatus Hydrogenedentota bacterium]
GVPPDVVERIRALRVTYESLVETINIDHELRDGDEVAGLRALYVPGHSASDILFHDPVRRVAFAGDHVLKGVSPSPLIRRPRPGEQKVRTLLEYRQSLQRTRALDFDICYPGHGSPFGNYREIIDTLLQRQERFTRYVYTLLEAGPFTPHQLMGMLFPRVALDTLHFGLSSVLGHLEILEDRGMAAADECEGVLFFRCLKTEG